MVKFGITSMTLSLEVGDKDYGKGMSHFANLTAKLPDNESIPLEQLDEVIDQGLDMYFALFKLILTDRFIAGIIKGEEYKNLLIASEARIEKIRGYLKNHESSKRS